MKTLKKSSKLDNVLYDVRGPVLDEANRMEAEGSKILKLNIGNPAPFGFEAPEEVLIDSVTNLNIHRDILIQRYLYGKKSDYAICTA